VVLFCTAAVVLGGAATWLFAPAAQDRLTSAEIEQRSMAFAKILPLQLKAVPAQELDTRLADMQLAPVAQMELKQMLQKSQAPQAAVSPTASTKALQIRLVELALWDSHAPDGDVVRVTSVGYSRDVVLHKQPIVLAVPVQGSMPIQITGVHDGGGGITLGVQGALAPVMVPIMSEGQTIMLPVAP
jgi:hypothetical protein